MSSNINAPVGAAVSIALILGSVQAMSAETTRRIAVEATPLPLLGGNRIIPEDGRGIAADGGDLLRQVPGVSGSRLGGKGIDPAIRGQSQNRINVLIDGAYVHGGCPNRMDPPASFANIEAYDRVTVLKGVQTLRYGGGGPGGTVLFERGAPRFGEGDDYRGRATASYGANGDRRALYGEFTAVTENGFLRLQASDAQAGNYEDGDGDKVRSAYQERGGVVTGGFNLAPRTRAELSLETTRADDVYYAGGMDAPVDDNDSVRLKLAHGGAVGPFSSMDAEVYRTDVNHLMDNYSLRTLTAPMRMKVEVDSVTTGVRLQGELRVLDALWTIGLDRQGNTRDAIRYGGPLPVKVSQSFMWPDVTIDQTGIFAEGEWAIGDAAMLKAGLRYDHVNADGDRFNQAAAMAPGGINTANGLYRQYYGVSGGEQDEHNIGGLLRYERDFRGGTWFAALSRAVRTADATERFMAANAAPSAPGVFAGRWVGNPEIKPEKHHQAELGANWYGDRWNAGVVVWGDWVDDYILRDRAHGQAGVLVADSASIYRNVDARLAGYEVQADWSPAAGWRMAANAAYVRARNTGDGRDIAQTPPLELSLAVDYTNPRWSTGATLRGAAGQSRVEDNPAVDSGLDVGETGGWAVLDLRARYAFEKLAAVDVGIDNLFDKTYAYHLNRGNDFDPATVQVNEPGRSAWVKLNLAW